MRLAALVVALGSMSGLALVDALSTPAIAARADAARAPAPATTALAPAPASAALAPAIATASLATAAADSATALRALIRAQAGSQAEVRAARWLASVPAGSAFDTTRTVALDVLVEAMVGDGHWSDSTSHATAARAVREKQLLYGPGHAEVGRSLITQARLLYRAGEFDAARASAESGLTLVERGYGERDRLVVRGLHYLANILEEQTDFVGAERLYTREIALAAQVFGVASPELANAINSQAVLDRKTGRLSEARILYERSLAMREAALGPDHPDLAGTLSNLANVFNQMGDFRKARQLYERGLSIGERKLTPDHPLMGELFGNLANAEASAGDTARALGHYARSLAIREKNGGPMNVGLAYVLGDQGSVLTAQGDFVNARAALSRALAIREKALAPDHPEIAQTFDAIGDLEMAVGDATAARRAYEHSLAIQERSLGGSHPDVARSLAGLARSLVASGDPAQALVAALRAEAVASAHLRLTARTQEERVALAYAATRPSGLDLAITLAFEAPSDSTIRTVWDAVIRSRAQVLDEMASRERSVVTGRDSVTLALADSLRETSAYLSRLIASGSGDTGARERLERAARDRDRVEEALAERSAEFRRTEATRAAGWSEVARAMQPNEALISFVRFHRWMRGRGVTGSPATTEPAYAAFVMRSSGAPSLVALGSAALVDSSVAHWAREAGRRPAPLTRARDEAMARDAGELLRRRIWDPLARAVGPATVLRIVPDGSLQLVSFASLPSRGGGYQVESPAVIELLSAERDLVDRHDAAPVGRGMLAMGAPDFGTAGGAKTTHASAIADPPHRGATPSPAATPTPAHVRRTPCDDLASLRFDPLPATRAEAREIAGLWRPLRSGEPAILCLGAQASESALRTQAPGKEILHLATHGFFISDECREAARGDTPNRGGTRGAVDSLTYDNPLLRSGLALAGANARASSSSGLADGIMTAEEVATLDLSGVDWAVLSACDTGRGEFRDGEGVLGLRRAFEVAGAHHLIMSLWAVDDEATRDWMRAMYRAHLVRGEGAARAVQSASRETLKARRAQGLSDHPFFWAAFVASGAGN